MRARHSPGDSFGNGMRAHYAEVLLDRRCVQLSFVRLGNYWFAFVGSGQKFIGFCPSLISDDFSSFLALRLCWNARRSIPNLVVAIIRLVVFLLSAASLLGKNVNFHTL